MSTGNVNSRPVLSIRAPAKLAEPRLADVGGGPGVRTSTTYNFWPRAETNLGPFRAGAPTWAAGDRIHLGRDTLEVVSLTVAEDGDEVDGYLIVRTKSVTT